MSNGVPPMVAKAIEEAGNASGVIDTLAIWGHGGSGSVDLSRGMESDRNADWAGIDIENRLRGKAGRDYQQSFRVMSVHHKLRDTLRHW